MINGMTLNNLLFVDDIDLIEDTKGNVQQLTCRVDGTSRRMGLRINTGKLIDNWKQHEDTQIKLGGKVLDQVTKFVYLGGTLTEDGRCTEDIRRRIGLTCAAFGKLDKMWRTRSISLKTKMKLYLALVLPVLMYGSECYKQRTENEKKNSLLLAEMAWFRSIRGRSRRDRIRNENTGEELVVEGTVMEKIKRRRLTWFGHVERMEGKSLLNVALHGHVRGDRSRGRQRKRWMDNVREAFKEKGVQLSTRYENTKNGEVWRN